MKYIVFLVNWWYYHVVFILISDQILVFTSRIIAFNLAIYIPDGGQLCLFKVHSTQGDIMIFVYSFFGKFLQLKWPLKLRISPGWISASLVEFFSMFTMVIYNSSQLSYWIALLEEIKYR